MSGVAGLLVRARDRLALARPPELRDDFIKAIVKREKRGSTGFGHGVAVPHVKHAAISKMAVAVAVSRAGIEFNALDKQPVYSVFLLLSPEDQPEEHLKAMEVVFNGIALQAMGITFGALFAILVLYGTGIIKVTETFKAVVP